jgi:hypothetical protein
MPGGVAAAVLFDEIASRPILGHDAVVMLPPAARPDDPLRYRAIARETRTTIEFGPIRLTRERTLHYTAAPAPDLVSRSAGRDWRLVGLAGVLCVAGLGGLGLASPRLASPGLPSRPAYSISLPVPASVDAPRDVVRRPSATPPAIGSHRVIAGDIARPAEVATADTGQAGDTPFLTKRADAVAAALRSGIMQEWRDSAGTTRGFVVAGPVADGCRMLSVLTRSADAGDRVEQMRECLPDAG